MNAATFNPLFNQTGLENLSSKELKYLVEKENDIFGKAMREQNRRLFQKAAPIVYQLTPELQNIWESISEKIPNAILSIESDNTIDITLQDVNFSIESSSIFPNTIEVSIKYLDFSNLNFIRSNEVASYIQGVIEDMTAEEKEMDIKEAYYYYQSKEMQETMLSLTEEDIFNLKF